MLLVWLLTSYLVSITMLSITRGFHARSALDCSPIRHTWNDTSVRIRASVPLHVPIRDASRPSRAEMRSNAIEKDVGFQRTYRLVHRHRDASDPYCFKRRDRSERSGQDVYRCRLNFVAAFIPSLLLFPKSGSKSANTSVSSVGLPTASLYKIKEIVVAVQSTAYRLARSA